MDEDFVWVYFPKAVKWNWIFCQGSSELLWGEKNEKKGNKGNRKMCFIASAYFAWLKLVTKVSVWFVQLNIQLHVFIKSWKKRNQDLSEFLPLFQL